MLDTPPFWGRSWKSEMGGSEGSWFVGLWMSEVSRYIGGQRNECNAQMRV